MSVIIYKPSKTATQSGSACTKNWVLEFLREDDGFFDAVMDWKGAKDMRPSQLKLKFASQQEAVSYAQRKGLAYSVVEDKPKKMKIKSYSSNFTKF